MERGPSQSGRSKSGVGVSREIAESITRAVDLPKGDSASYAGDHSLASILNNPHIGKSGVYGSDASWASWFSSGSTNPAELPPFVLNKTFPEIARSDFSRYLASISEPYGRFVDIQHHTIRELFNSQQEAAGLDGSVGDSDVVVRGQGESLVACLREVPSLFFKEDFALEDGGTFRAACPFSSISETGVLQEKLSHYLDIVELHLVKEISLRSDSFFEAQVQLQDLNGRIVESCGRLHELKSTIRLLDNDLVGSAKNVQELNKKRSNLLALQQKLRLILYVNQALSALKLVSGLKSITAKHLALASQVISFFYALMPETRCILFTKVPESRKALLSSELDRVAQDYKVHRDEIHGKLVQIMKERLLVHLRALPQIAENWNRTEDTDPQPSQFARALTKEVGVLQRVLSRTLLEQDVIEIFRQVIEIFHSQLTEAFSKLDLNTPQAKNRLFRDVQHILACIHALPAPKLSGESTPKSGKLDDFLAQRFQSEAGQ